MDHKTKSLFFLQFFTLLRNKAHKILIIIQSCKGNFKVDVDLKSDITFTMINKRYRASIDVPVNINPSSSEDYSLVYLKDKNFKSIFVKGSFDITSNKNIININVVWQIKQHKEVCYVSLMLQSE